MDNPVSRHIAAICAHCDMPLIGRESCPFGDWHGRDICLHGRALIAAAREGRRGRGRRRQVPAPTGAAAGRHGIRQVPPHGLWRVPERGGRMNLGQVTTMLVQEEGERLSAYEDHLGWLTIGVGRLIDARKGGGITREESRYLLANDIRRFDSHARVTYPWYAALDDTRQGVVLGMLFQLGQAGFAGFRNTIKAIAEGRYDDAEAGMLGSKWAAQTPARARRMARAMSTGTWPY